MFCCIKMPNKRLLRRSSSCVEFPPQGYIPNPINALLANALDLTAPASDALLKGRKSAWIQLSGHPGSFAPAGPHSIWKKRLTKDNNETLAYKRLMKDSVKKMVPHFYREVDYNGDIFIEIEDLLQHFHNPSLIDVKVGTRTFLESEVKNLTSRRDLYEKMVKLNPNEPTAEEHEAQAVTKLRYMQFREQSSTSSTLGFRIEAMKIESESTNTELRKIKSLEEVQSAFKRFLRFREEIRVKFLKRLKEIRHCIENSKFFSNHEIIGSSLLFLWDSEGRASIWMIDFAKSIKIAKGHTLTHRIPWLLGNHEDGYLTGIDSIIRIFSELDFKAEDNRLPTNQDNTHRSHDGLVT